MANHLFSWNEQKLEFSFGEFSIIIFVGDFQDTTTVCLQILTSWFLWKENTVLRIKIHSLPYRVMEGYITWRKIFQTFDKKNQSINKKTWKSENKRQNFSNTFKLTLCLFCKRSFKKASSSTSSMYPLSSWVKQWRIIHKSERAREKGRLDVTDNLKSW